MHRLKVINLDPSGLAVLAGVKLDDFIDSYDDIELSTTEELIEAVNNATGDTHELLIFRKGEFVTLKCGGGRLGVTVEPINLELERDAGHLELYRKHLDEKRQKAMKGVTLTTANNIDGHTSEVVDIITSECAFGMNLFKDFFAAMSDVFGGRNKSTQKVLKDARKTCLDELRLEATRLGADAVIAVKLDYSEFSGGGKSMLFLVASGTAVKLKKQ